MTRYVLNHWTIRFARLAHRLERATATAIEHVWNEDSASHHYEGRSLTWWEELPIWRAGFKEGWISAGADGHSWFEVRMPLIATRADTSDR